MEVKIDSTRIKSEREKRAWSQEHLAAAAGVGLRTVQRIEKTGRASPESIRSLAAALSLAIADLQPAPEIAGDGGADSTLSVRFRLTWGVPSRLGLLVIAGMFPALYAKRQPDLGIAWDLLLGYVLPAVVIVGAFVWARREFRTHPVSRAAAYSAAVAFSYFLAASAFYYTPVAAAQTGAEWRDPSPHSTRLVTVEDGVELEVLDWGGSGRPLLLLAGLGDSAHVFDEFAPLLSEKHRVYAVSRRGFGRSSDPSEAIGFDRLAEDVVGVLDALDLEQAVVVGHSFAGEEMHVLGSRHASSIAALIYIDAAFDRSRDFAEYDAKLGELPRFAGPQPSDLASTSTLRAFWARNRMPTYPEAEVRNRFVVDPDGTISGRAQPGPAVQQAYSATMRETQEGYDPGPLSVPALAIYAVPVRPEDLMRPWFEPGDSSVRQTLEELLVLSRERFRQHQEWFQALAGDSARVLELPGDHYLFVTHPSEVKEAVEAFVSSLD